MSKKESAQFIDAHVKKAEKVEEQW